MSAEPADNVEPINPDPDKNISDAEIVPPSGGKYSGFVIPILILVLLVAGVGYFAATQSGLDKAAVEEVLTGWAKQLKRATSKDGLPPVIFTYESVEMAGVAANRHAIVNKPTFTTRADSESKEMSFTTAQAMIKPSSIAFDEMRIALTEPIEILSDVSTIGRVSYKEPVILDIKIAKEDGVEYLTSSASVPSKLVIDSLVEKNTLDVEMDTGASLVFKMVSDGSSIAGLALNVSHLSVTGADDAVISLGKMQVDVKNALQDDDMYAVSMVLDVQDAKWPEEKQVYGSVSASSDVSYKGPLPEEGTFDFSNDATHLQVKQLQIKNENAYVSLKGDVYGVSKELLPIGNLHLKVGNFAFVRDELRRQGVISQEEWPLVGALFKRITGDALDKAENVDVKITREAQKSLHIGSITFEEALAIILTGGKLLPKEAPADSNKDGAEKPADNQPAIAPEAIPTDKTQG